MIARHAYVILSQCPSSTTVGLNAFRYCKSVNAIWKFTAPRCMSTKDNGSKSDSTDEHSKDDGSKGDGNSSPNSLQPPEQKSPKTKTTIKATKSDRSRVREMFPDIYATPSAASELKGLPLDNSPPKGKSRPTKEDLVALARILRREFGKPTSAREDRKIGQQNISELMMLLLNRDNSTFMEPPLDAMRELQELIELERQKPEVATEQRSEDHTEEVTEEDYFPEFAKRQDIDGKPVPLDPLEQLLTLLEIEEEKYDRINVAAWKLPQTPPTRVLYYSTMSHTLQKSDFVRILKQELHTDDSNMNAAEIDALVKYLDFEFFCRRDTNFVRRRGYYLRFADETRAEQFCRVMLKAKLHGESLVPDYTSLQEENEVLNYVESQYGMHIAPGRTVLVADIPRGIEVDDLLDHIGDTFELDGPPKQAIISVPTLPRESRYLVRLKSASEAYRLILRFHKRGWDDNSSVGADIQLLV
ncbi:uncharacterized protein V1518DRAFT_408206 [Limtongia smithiae]|uniref:uncharacterized protein n=1 Tax=Limtongia smithiae TaxID=1125753 RepID=UPI0034CE2857